MVRSLKFGEKIVHEDIEWKKRRLSFLKEEFASKKTELNSVLSLLKCEQARSTVKMFHHNQEDKLSKISIKKRSITAEVDKLEFEIADLETELRKWFTSLKRE